MSQPYCAQSDVLNQVLTELVAQAQWNLTDAPTDITLRIQEGDAKIDSRLAALGYTLPFATNPPLLKSLSVDYARYACLRDLYAGGSATSGGGSKEEFKKAFDEAFKELETGLASLVNSSGAVIPSSKFNVNVAQNMAPINVAPGALISDYSEAVDAGDGLAPAVSDSPEDD